ncbi:MAG: BRCT domain-containing protein [Gemmatimonadales bacterium]
MIDDGELARKGRYQRTQMTDRAFHELIGICRGVIWDGAVTDEEIVRLDEWCRTFPQVYDTFPGNVLARRIKAALEDGLVEDHERAEIQAILEELTGGRDDADRSTSLPLTSPAPRVEVQGRRFCLTGNFIFGTRKRCEEAVRTAGGLVEPRVTRDLDYLVIGHRASPLWAHSSYGRKIEAAVHLTQMGHPLAIVSEVHWSREMLTRLEERGFPAG